MFALSILCLSVTTVLAVAAAALSDSREWIVDVVTAERFLAEIDAASCRQPAVKPTFSARMLNRLLEKLGPLAILGGAGRG